MESSSHSYMLHNTSSLDKVDFELENEEFPKLREYLSLMKIVMVSRDIFFLLCRGADIYVDFGTEVVHFKT